MFRSGICLVLKLNADVSKYLHTGITLRISQYDIKRYHKILS